MSLFRHPLLGIISLFMHKLTGLIIKIQSTLQYNVNCILIISPVNLCIKREIIPNKGIPLPRCSDRSPETPKFAVPLDVEKCHFRATPIWIMGKFRDF